MAGRSMRRRIGLRHSAKAAGRIPLEICGDLAWLGC
jgi:hypothetical protein